MSEGDARPRGAIVVCVVKDSRQVPLTYAAQQARFAALVRIRVSLPRTGVVCAALFAMAMAPARLGGVPRQQPTRMPSRPDTSESLTDPETYRVFDALIGPSKGGDWRLLILARTETKPACIPSKVPPEWKEVLDDFVRVNAASRVLQDKFSPQTRHQLVAEPPPGFMDGSAKVAILTLSAVGFNRTKTRAVVYSFQAVCGLCGGGVFQFFEKSDGRWKRSSFHTSECIVVS